MSWAISLKKLELGCHRLQDYHYVFRPQCTGKDILITVDPEACQWIVFKHQRKIKRNELKELLRSFVEGKHRVSHMPPASNTNAIIIEWRKK
jgi:hypothetical protein